LVHSPAHIDVLIAILRHEGLDINILIRISKVSISMSKRTILTELALPFKIKILTSLGLVVIVRDI
jgi:hypothetical protein